MRDNPYELGRKLRLARIRARLTITETAERAGITRPNLSAYERSAKRPSWDTIVAIARVLDVSLDSLAPNIAPGVDVAHPIRYDGDSPATNPVEE